MAVDPVERMAVSEENAPCKMEYKDATYYFCGRGCKERFEKDPEKYLKEEKADWIKD